MILNRQKGVRVSVLELERFLERARRELHIRSGALTVCLVSNAQMARWNRAFRKKAGPTDVLSFPADDSGDRPRVKRKAGAGHSAGAGNDGFNLTSFASSASYLGDIAIAPAVARKNARRFGRTLPDELRILILHGALHLLGYDHESDDGQMDRLEQAARGSLGLA
jgi:probable rRNA maturation factor